MGKKDREQPVALPVEAFCMLLPPLMRGIDKTGRTISEVEVRVNGVKPPLRIGRFLREFERRQVAAGILKDGVASDESRVTEVFNGMVAKWVNGRWF